MRNTGEGESVSAAGEERTREGGAVRAAAQRSEEVEWTPNRRGGNEKNHG